MAHADHGHDARHGHGHGYHHIIPQKTLLTVFGALVALTIFTVFTAQIDLGSFNVPLAMVIALTKAALVVTFFMALKYDSRVNTLVFVIGAIFVVVFLVFTLFDAVSRGDLGNVSETTIQDQQRAEEELMQREPAPEALRVNPAGDTTPEGEGSADTTAAASTPGATGAAPTAPADTTGEAGH